METILITITTLTGIGVISMLIKGNKAKDTANKIGVVTCKRCGHEGHAISETTFKVGAGVQTSFTCGRCGSEDWQAE